MTAWLITTEAYDDREQKKMFYSFGSSVCIVFKNVYRVSRTWEWNRKWIVVCFFFVYVDISFFMLLCVCVCIRRACLFSRYLKCVPAQSKKFFGESFKKMFSTGAEWMKSMKECISFSPLIFLSFVGLLDGKQRPRYVWLPGEKKNRSVLWEILL